MGHSLKLAKKRVNTDLRHHFFSDRVINNWNSLDDRTATSGTLNIFKNNLERLRSSQDGSVCWHLMLLDPLRLSRSAGEASSGELPVSNCQLPAKQNCRTT